MAIGTDAISAISSKAVRAYVVRAISGLAIGTDAVSTISSEAVCAYMVRAISSLAVGTYTVGTISSEAIGADVIRTVSSNTTNVSVRRTVFCNYHSINGVMGINSRKCKSATCKNGESEAEDQFVSFHGGCSRSIN